MPENIQPGHARNDDSRQSSELHILAQKMRENIPVSADYTERLFLDLAIEQGLLVSEAEMITLDREKRRKGDKRSTVPDFLVKENIADEGIYVEVTENNAQDAHKNRQRGVMVEAGLGSRYVQLIASELEEIQRSGASLIDYLKAQINEARD